MKLSNRELMLAWLVAILLLFGGTWWFSRPSIRAWGESKAERARLERRIRSARRLLNRQVELDETLAGLRKELPRYPMGDDVTSILLRDLEKTARENGVTLTRRDPGDEKQVEDLYEISFFCKWQADLEALVRFLYALQTRGAILDMKQLSITPGRRGEEALNGSFNLNYAYSRAAPEAAAPENEGAEPAAP